MKSKVVSGSFLKFLVTGSFATASYFLISELFLRICGFSFFVSTIVAYSIVLIISFLINSYWTFQTIPHLMAFVRFLLVSLGSLVIVLLVGCAQEYYNINQVLAQFIIIITAPPVSYLCHRYWTFDKFSQ